MKSTGTRVPSTRYRLKNCRICGSARIKQFLSLHYMPIPNGFVPKKDIKKKEFHFPLKVCVCTDCWLVQLTHVIPAEIMFRNYLYIPSTSTTVVAHFREMADHIIKNFNVKRKDLVIDIGSNDGTLLSNFQKKNIPVLGVDPAENIARQANKNGIRTLCTFFTEEKAQKIAQEYGKAKIITATNVIAHIQDLHDVMKGIALLLQDNGIFVMEAPYLADLVERNEFDTIYHEHLSYFSVHPLEVLFHQHGLKIIDIQKQSIHGGSLRVFVAKQSADYTVHPRVEKFLIEEKAKNLQNIKTYDDFALRVKKVKRDLLQFLRKIRKEGKTIIGYGAAAKGNVLLNYCDISTDLLDYIVDSIPYKQGKYTPGTHIPIYPESKIVKAMPDYTLILAWNFADEIIRKNQEYVQKGGRFIIPVPYLKIV